MNTRRATPKDAVAIAEVHVRSWQAAYAGLLDPAFLAGLSVEGRAEGWRSALGAEDSTTMVAEVEDKVVAFASYGARRTDGITQDRGEIWAIYALPVVWGKGAGRLLLEEAMSALDAAGKRDCSLWVLTGNARGLAFYRRAGFREVPESHKVFELGGRQVEEVELNRALMHDA